MRILKVTLITLVVCLVGILLLSCASESGSPPPTENQVVTVQRGNLIIDITAAGNLALSRTEDLAFEISGTTQEPLTVEEVLVEEGDSVTEGQVIARLDTTSLEQALTTAQRAVKTAEIDLESATNSYLKLITPYPYVTYELTLPESVDSIRLAQQKIKQAQEEIHEGLSGEQYSLAEIKERLMEAQELLSEVESKLDWIVLDEEVRPGSLGYWTLRAAQLSVEKAQLALDKANDTLDKAKDELEKTVIVAPFDGFITKVNVEGGDEVKRGTVAVVIADPNKFEADVMVSEMDILQVKLGGEAWVELDAMSGLTLPAKVTHISPTATIQSGVVNYKVKVEIESLEAVMKEQQAARQEAMQRIQQGELPERLQQAIEEGRITREQAEEMIKQRQQAQEGQQGQVPTAIPEDFQLREGLTVTVSIIVDERNDVLLVPNSALTRRGMETYVQVLKEGVIEERSIKTGISNWQFTEVTDGLSEDEQVVIPQVATATPTTPSPRGPLPFLPGRPH